MITVAVSDKVDESAFEVARKELVRGYAAFAWPVVVDLASGRREFHVGRPKIGFIFNGWMRQQIDVAAPTPSGSVPRA